MTRHPVPSRDVCVRVCPRAGQTAPAFSPRQRVMEQAACRRCDGTVTSRVSVKIARLMLATRRPRALTRGRPTGTNGRSANDHRFSVQREPLFNIPAVIVAILAVLALVHGVREWLLTQDQDIWVVYAFGFVPARYDASVLVDGGWPGGFGAEIWTFVTYSLLHGSWTHFGVNAIWLPAFGTPVARRFGALRFLAFFAVTAAAGAAHASCHQCRLAGADDRRFGIDLGRDGGGDAFRLSARRSARLVCAQAMTNPTACRRCRSPAY